MNKLGYMEVYGSSYSKLPPVVSFAEMLGQLSEEIVWYRVPICGLLCARLKVLVLVVLGRCREDVEEALTSVAYFQNTGHIATAVAVVGCAPYRSELIIVQYLKSLLAELMCAQDVVHVIDREELLDHLATESVACTPRRQIKLVSFHVRV